MTVIRTTGRSASLLYRKTLSIYARNAVGVKEINTVAESPGGTVRNAGSMTKEASCVAIESITRGMVPGFETMSDHRLVLSGTTAEKLCSASLSTIVLKSCRF